MTGESLLRVKTSAPYRKTLVATYLFTPLVRVMTAMTDETPMTTPRSVSTVRSLLAQRDWSATLNASLNSIWRFRGEAPRNAWLGGVSQVYQPDRRTGR